MGSWVGWGQVGDRDRKLGWVGPGWGYRWEVGLGQVGGRGWKLGYVETSWGLRHNTYPLFVGVGETRMFAAFQQSVQFSLGL